MALPLLVSCGSSYSNEEQIAIDYLQQRMKNPSAFKVIEISSSPYEEETKVEYDTTFFFDGIMRGTSSSTIDPFKAGEQYDSIKVDKITKQAAKGTLVKVKYEGTNSFNATLQENKMIIVKDGKAKIFRDFLEEVITREVAESKKYDSVQTR